MQGHTLRARRAPPPAAPLRPPQAHPDSIALFVPCEVTTYCFYPGKQKDFLVSNALFRMVRRRAATRPCGSPAGPP